MQPAGSPALRSKCAQTEPVPDHLPELPRDPQGVAQHIAIDRREFDLKWNQTLPNGNLLVSNEVKLLVSVSAVKSA